MKRNVFHLSLLLTVILSSCSKDNMIVRNDVVLPGKFRIPCTGSCDDLSEAGYNFICVTPSDIGTGINPDFDLPHVVSTPTTTSNNYLLLFLVGTNMDPNACSKFYKQANNMGYHVIALSYVNGNTVPDPCANVNSASLQALSKEVFDGINHSNMAEVDVNNCIQTRLKNLLTYLKSTYPNDGWNSYLKLNGTIAWNKIVVAGRSLGGMHAAMIGSFKSNVKRVICFSSPREMCSGITSTWPPLLLDKYFCFSHTQDLYAKQQAVWSNMGFTETPTSVDTNSPPYGNAHLLTSSVTTNQAHKCTTVNCNLPAAGWSDVWGYLLTL